jgi:hypothetical protein
MSEKASVTLKAFLIHAATDPKLQQLLAALNGEQLVAYLMDSGLSAEDASLYAAARTSQEGKQAFVEAMNKRQSEAWVTSADAWITAPDGWTTSADGWTTSADGWTTSAEDWTTSPDAWTTGSEE